LHAFAQQQPSNVQIPLVVPAGTPLRLEVLNTTFPKHVGDPVRARVAEPVFAFDKEVIPAGTLVTGHVAAFNYASRLYRVQKMMSGNFGSFRQPQVQFDSLLTKGEPARAIDAKTTPGNGQIVTLQEANTKKRGTVGSAVDRGKQEVKTRMDTAKAFLHNQHKGQVVKEAALGLLPYQKPKVATGARFDAILSAPQQFGTESVPTDQILELGTVTPEEGETRANLLTGVNSGSTTVGSPVEAVLTAPLFSASHRLILPEGTELLGKTNVARPARKLHRNGQLRFSFQEIVLPPNIVAIQKQLSAQAAENSRRRIDASIGGLAVGSGSHVSVDAEGGARITESKSRFIAPAISVALAAAASSQENERGHVENPTGAQAGAGAIGFGLAGAVLGRVSHPAGMALGFAGAARSVYAQFLGKGFDIRIPKDTLLLIQFSRTGGSQAAATPSRQPVAGQPN
jgi:hypothetical protein